VLTLGFVVPLLAAALATTTFFCAATVLYASRHYSPRAVHTPSSPSVIMQSDIVTLSAAEALKQLLDALVITVEAAEEKIVTARRRVLAAR
jgi:hypothetical protein